MNAIDQAAEAAAGKRKASDRDQEGRRRLRHLELLLEVEEL